jgi:hypothetical protein
MPRARASGRGCMKKLFGARLIRGNNAPLRALDNAQE